MKQFTYGRRLNRRGAPYISIRERIMRIEERREMRMTLKKLYEKKSLSISGTRDKLFLSKIKTKDGKIIN